MGNIKQKKKKKNEELLSLYLKKLIKGDENKGRKDFFGVFD